MGSTEIGASQLPLPPVYLVHNEHLRDDELQKVMRQLGDALRYDIKEAKVVLAKGIKGPRRAIQELQSLGIDPQSVNKDQNNILVEATIGDEEPSSNKRRKLDKLPEKKDDVPVTPTRRALSQGSSPVSPRSPATDGQNLFHGDTVKFLSLEWYLKSLKAKSLLPFEQYMLWEGTFGDKKTETSLPAPVFTILPTQERRKKILERAREDTPPRQQHYHENRHRNRSGESSSQTESQKASLLRETTSEHDIALHLPPLPSYFNSPFSCHWHTPLNGPNEEFISQLKLIREQRLLTRDTKVSADQKSRAIAAIAAYPYPIISQREISRLPGCGPSTVGLFQEWKETGRIKDVEDLEQDEKFQALKTFYGIYDVGAKKALEFYKKGWRDLDDLVENWNALTPNQQVGVKYYDDFAEKIPRAEVEHIGEVILRYANEIQNGFQMVVTGGYRRGKSMSGDVDVILTHPDEDATYNFIKEILYRLGKDGWVTVELVHSSKNSAREQEPVTWKGSMPRSGVGFDTLDKGLVVWQNADLLKKSNVRNPKRRVDIIVSPWKTAGCAIIGWTGGTQFEKDIRRYVATLDPPMKFDSSGVVLREGGEWQDLESDCMDLLEKEKRVFEGLKLEWRDPTERCN